MTNNQRFKALRQFGCVECGSRPVDIAHSNFSEHGKGKGIKADDEWQAKLKLGKMCSTTGGNASVALMNQYLNSINQWAYIHNIPLTIPDELKWVRN